jgi:hypothetical protein
MEELQMVRVKFSEDLRPVQTTAERLELQRAVEEAERDLAEGYWVENPEILAKFKRWSSGETWAGSSLVTAKGGR